MPFKQMGPPDVPLCVPLLVLLEVVQGVLPAFPDIPVCCTWYKLPLPPNLAAPCSQHCWLGFDASTCAFLNLLWKVYGTLTLYYFHLT